MNATTLWVWFLPSLIGIGFGAAGILALKNGKTYMKTGRLVTKVGDPFRFWLTVACLLAISAITISIVIYHLLISN